MSTAISQAFRLEQRGARLGRPRPDAPPCDRHRALRRSAPRRGEPGRGLPTGAERSRSPGMGKVSPAWRALPLTHRTHSCNFMDCRYSHLVVRFEEVSGVFGGVALCFSLRLSHHAAFARSADWRLQSLCSVHFFLRTTSTL